MNDRTEPLAIVGIGLRLPGGINSPELLWKALEEGQNLVTDVPPDRWDIKSFYDPERGRVGKVYAKKGGFLNDIAGFDAEFFGISPYEAGYMDPQQRLMLEVAWEALEDGGLAPEKLAGSKTGVFIGASLHEYENLNFDRNDHRLYGTYSATGMGMSILANRISYIFDLKGPSITIDTACSSSLVAVHLACRSLLAGETDIGIAGGVQVLIRPDSTMTLCKGGFLSPDGCCRSFDSGANGYVRSEGVGVVVIRRLASALENKDPIYALICGSAVNQDGRSAGLTVPSEDAQKRVINEALDQAGILAHDVHYVEAHGTGTPVGDPVEARSIGAVLSRNRSKDDRLIIGSVKSNLGHTESTAGVVGLVKAALMLKNGKIPPNLHFVEPSPHIDFEELNIRVPTVLEPWPDTGLKPRVAGVNSFGFGGTNAHVVLKECPHEPANQENYAGMMPLGNPMLFPFSARSEEALKALAADMSRFLDDADGGKNAELAALAASAALHRSHHSYRLPLIASTKKELSELLQAYVAGEARPEVAPGRMLQKNPLKLAFVFSGMGQQWLGMGKVLYGKEPVFRGVIDRCGELFSRHTSSWNLVEELFADEEKSRIDETRISQPCIFAVQVALNALWHSRGIKPDVIIGHSVGEVAGYCAAGILSLEDAVTVCFHRSRLQQTLAGSGGMLAVGLSETAVAALLTGLENKVSIAAINGPDSITLAGEVDALSEISRACEEKNIFQRFLNVEVPYHSAVMDSIRSPLKDSLDGIRPEKGQVPVISTVSGAIVNGTSIDGDYWAENIRKPVLFKTAIEQLINLGTDIFVEVSAHPVLSPYLRESFETGEKSGVVVHSLKRGENDEMTFLRAVAKIYTSGFPVCWQSFYPSNVRRVKLPAYPWQRRHCWLESDESRKYRLGKSDSHPLLGERMNIGVKAWNSTIDFSRHQYLRDHVVQGGIVFPAAAYLEMAFEGFRRDEEANCAVVEEIEMIRPLIFNPETDTHLQMTLDDDEKFSVFSRPQEDGAGWTLHAQGRFGSVDRAQSFPETDIEEIARRCEKKVEPAALYEGFHKKGLVYGKAFQGIDELWIGEDEALGRIDSSNLETSDSNGYNIHPAILDACFQVMGAFGVDGTYLPLRFERAGFYARPGKIVFCHARLTERTRRWLTGDLAIYGPDGALLLEIEGFKCQRMLDQEDVLNKKSGELLYEFEWKLDEECLYEGVPLNHFLVDSCQLKEALHSSLIELLAADNRATRYETVFSKLNGLALLYIIEMLKKSGVISDGRQVFSVSDALEGLAAGPENCGMLMHYLRVLVDHQLLRKTGNGEGFTLAETIPESDPAARWFDLMSREPGWRCELSMLERYGARLAEIIRGGARPSIPEHFFNGSATARHAYKAIRLAVEAILKNLPEGHMIRVLEIGAGTGGVTSTILPLLPSLRTRYCFTDVSDDALNQAMNRFSAEDFFEYRIFDLRRGPEEQEFPLQAYDLVISSMVFDQIPDVHKAIDSICRMTAPGGLFILLEPAGEFSWYNFITGSSERLDWSDILRSNGFKDAEAVFPVDGTDSCGFQMIVGKKAPAIVTETDYSAGLPVRGRSNEKTKNNGYCILFADSTDLAENLANRLEQKGMANLSLVNPDKPLSYAELIDSVWQDRSRTMTIINLVGSGGPTPKADFNCMVAVQILQALVKQKGFESASFWTITRGVQPLEGVRELALAEAPVWGLMRVMAAEHPEISFRTVDLSPEPSDIELKNLIRFLLSPDDEDEFVLRDRYRFVNRLTRMEHRVRKGTEVAFCLDKGSQNSLEGLTYVEKPRRAPGRGEVEIKIHATGINVKDVLKTTGMFENLSTYDGNLLTRLGFECSGVVTAVGEGVAEFKAGDEVMGIVSDCFASHATTSGQTLVCKPDHLSHEEAAAMPVAFMTAHYALVDLAGIKRGDRVVVHTATGGVGLAAINIARKAGAEVFATAGSPEKREFLRSLGIKYVGDSRSLKFADEIRRIAGSEGVDIVLNTLPGKAIRKGMSILKPVTGRFIDISNIYNESLKVHFPEKGIAVHSFDLERMGGVALTSIWKELQKYLIDGSYQPIPFRTYPMAEVGRAFKNVSKGLHIGKGVVSFEEPGMVIVANCGKIPVTRDGSYLVTGGLRGFGLASAKWLAACGAANLILVSRSGASGEEAEAALAEFERQGVRVTVERVNVSDEAQVDDLMKRIERTLPPLKGIVHAAMVLDDAAIVNMDGSRMKNVCDPKIRGAWNLHRCTSGSSLDFFICYSSISTAIGNVGQGNYAAANYYLESLARYRKLHGLPALTLSLGPLGEAGYVARNPEVRNRLNRLGMSEVALESVWQAICLGLRQQTPVFGVYNADWNTVAKYNRQIVDSPKFSKLGGMRFKKPGADDSDLEGLLRMPSEERIAELGRILSREISRFLGLDLQKISIEEPISGFGIDSFTVVELIIRIEKIFSLRLQKMVFFRPGLSIKGLAEIVEKEIVRENSKE